MGKTLIDLTGKKFNRLTVIKRSYPNNNWGNAKWLCKCDCGKEKVIEGSNLTRSLTKSCGCLRNEKRRLKPGLASMRRVINSYKGNARKKGLEYNLTETQFKEIVQRDCFYCGAKPNNILNVKGLNGAYTYNGIDRIDNNKGYIVDNVVPCCKICNEAKKTRTLQEYKDWIEKSYNKMFRY